MCFGITKTIPARDGQDAVDSLYDGTLSEYEFHMAGTPSKLKVGDYVYTIFRKTRILYIACLMTFQCSDWSITSRHWMGLPHRMGLPHQRETHRDGSPPIVYNKHMVMPGIYILINLFEFTAFLFKNV
ncbi:MAG: hypothetical protein GY702_25055 [Desulfobulbaceae bacterium]|nr:hypothetical protein [Desulfobulbaceae bacterium]